MISDPDLGAPDVRGGVGRGSARFAGVRGVRADAPQYEAGYKKVGQGCEAGREGKRGTKKKYRAP